MHQGRQRLSLRLSAILVLAGAVGCRAKPTEPRDTSDVPLAVLGPVPAPEGLLAELAMGTPDATWQRLQRGVGGAAGILPFSLGGMLCAVSGIDPNLAPDVDGARAAYAVVAGDPSAPGWVVAVRLVEERRARGLYEGESARFDARDAGEGILLLAAKGRAPSPSVPVAAIARGGWLVVGRTASDLAALGPYATRTLPTRPAPKEAVAIDLPPSAAAALAADALHRWGATKEKMLADDQALRAEHGGRAPDFGEPRAIVGALDTWIQGQVAVLRDLHGAHVGIAVGDDDVRAEVTSEPASAGGAASALLAKLHPTALAPLLAMPRDTALAVLGADDADARARDAARLEATLTATLGTRLAPADQARVHAAVDDWTRGRGDWGTLAVVYGADGRGLVADVAAADPALVARGIHDGLDVASRIPALRDPLQHWLHVRDVRFGAADVPGAGRASTATFVAESPPSYALAWLPGHGDVRLALTEAHGADPPSLVAASLPGRTLADDPATRALLGGVDDAGASQVVSGVVLAEPGRLPGCAGTPGGVAIAWGKRGKESKESPALWVEVAASDPALRCLAKTSF